MIRKILKFLWIIQEKKHTDEFKRTYFKKRLNPFNPLTYITIFITFLIGFLMFGIIGFWQEVNRINPFYWH